MVGSRVGGSEHLTRWDRRLALKSDAGPNSSVHTCGVRTGYGLLQASCDQGESLCHQTRTRANSAVVGSS